MKKLIILAILFAALGTTKTQAQYRQVQTVWGQTDQKVYRDNRGEYRYEIRERRVWIPEYRTAGIFGIGSRRVPGHYEMRNERVRVYTRQNRNQHPHGMPPGQRKKSNNNYDQRYGRDKHDDNYGDRNQNGRYDNRRNQKGHGKGNNDRY
ncbi:MAG: hypothetical protein Q8S11_07610 [Daejeonella sp.]|uniref:hypothetical protein n=1 Tax=Daejeonella sp. TaxID=2805397 RepID=UPI002733873C|nr:hypothetical protein [Daejeonella sp.]MDP3468186.1 hypothetical protein [Daejeonella sp.]